jgi:hypothetical protein
MGAQSSAGGGIRPARIGEAAALSDLCIRSKAVWGYDEWFMAQAREALQVSVEEIAAGDVWVATAADGRTRSTSTSSSWSRDVSAAGSAARCSIMQRGRHDAGARRG